jgi:hypothetical protein
MLCIRFLLLAGAAAIVLAQTSTGVIDGLVLDPSEAVIRSARIVVTETATGRALELQTNEEGRYVAANLAAGNYTLRIEAAGFDTLFVTGIPIRAGEVYNGNVILAVGRMDTVVTVQATDVSVDAVRHSVDTIITGREIRNYPLIGSRNPLALAALSAGVTVVSGGSLMKTKTGPAYLAVGVAGRLGAGTRILLDGINVTDPVEGSTLLNASSEIVQQFQVTLSSQDPATPTTSSGVVQLTTQGGSNEVHGTGFWQFLNEHLGARPDYEPTVQPFHRKQFGARVGGPFRRDRLFWSAGGEATRQSTFRSARVVEFPQLTVGYNVPNSTSNANARLDWNATSSARDLKSAEFHSHDWRMAGLTRSSLERSRPGLTNRRLSARPSRRCKTTLVCCWFAGVTTCGSEGLPTGSWWAGVSAPLRCWFRVFTRRPRSLR